MASKLSQLFKPGAIFGKGGVGSKVLAGVGNIAISKLSGGMITNVFNPAPAKTPEELRAQNNASATLSAMGSAVGTFQALYQPSPQAIAKEAQASANPFSAENAEKTVNNAGYKSFLAQYWYFIIGAFGLVFFMFKRK
jgi:hypothetical protein